MNGGELAEFSHDIKLEHSLFALPFAFIGALGPVHLGTAIPLSFMAIIFILLAMFFARTAAMGFNRLHDAKIDRENPRTSSRAIPAGRLRPRTARSFVIISSAAFIAVSFEINQLAGWLSIPALAIVLGYSTTKRFTNWSHLVLGLALSLAPAGGWIAVSGRLDQPVLFVMAGVILWVAGFDILYSLQDIEFDKEHGLRSVPARFGPGTARIIAAGFHILAVSAFWIYGSSLRLGAGWEIACLLTAVTLATEHYLAKDRNRIPVAFFHLNSVIGFILLIGFLFDL